MKRAIFFGMIAGLLATLPCQVVSAAEAGRRWSGNKNPPRAIQEKAVATPTLQLLQSSTPMPLPQSTSVIDTVKSEYIKPEVCNPSPDDFRMNACTRFLSTINLMGSPRVYIKISLQNDPHPSAILYCHGFPRDLWFDEAKNGFGPIGQDLVDCAFSKDSAGKYVVDTRDSFGVSACLNPEEKPTQPFHYRAFIEPEEIKMLNAIIYNGGDGQRASITLTPLNPGGVVEETYDTKEQVVFCLDPDKQFMESWTDGCGKNCYGK